MHLDFPEPELREYRSAQVDPVDFDDFWARTLAETRAHDLSVTATPFASGLATIDVWDLTFCGFGGHPIRAWLRMPAGATEPLPTVVEFAGYGRGRGRAVENLLWPSAGFAHVIMDTRGQGWSGTRGDTADPVGSASQVPGFFTRGIESRESYYFRRLFVDAVRTVEASRSLPMVDPNRTAVLGMSQGGGMALAAAGLIPDLAAVVAYVPCLSDFPRATVITDEKPYREIVEYLAMHRTATASVHETLAYFDAVNFAKRATAPLWMSAALMDAICPPSTVFGAYNNYAGPKRMTVWPYNGHEGGGIEDELIALDALRELLQR